MRKIALLLFTTVFPGLFSKAQVFYVEEAKLVMEFNQYQAAVGNTPPKHNLPYSEISGSPYLSREFVESEIISKDSILYINVKFRYNIYSDEMEFIRNNELLSLSNPMNFRYFLLGDDVFVYESFVTQGGSPKRGYFQLLNPGPSGTLLKRYSVSYSPPEEAQPYAAAKPARFSKATESFYIQFPGNLPAELSMNRRRILDVFPDKKKELENFISSSKLNFRNEKDLKRLVEYYNQL